MNTPLPSQGADHPGTHANPAQAGERTDADAAIWLARKQDGLTPAEQAELQDWLSGDPARRVKLDQLSRLWGQLGELPPVDVAALKAAIAPASSRHTDLVTSGVPKPDAQQKPVGKSARQPGWQQWLAGCTRLVPRAAIAGAAFIIASGGWLGWKHWQQQPVFEQSISTVRGQQRLATLPDGSTLHLDTATRLDVSLFRLQREVRMPQGQVLFDVKSDPARPFHVVAGPLRITVLGTRFSVRHTREGIEAGRVSVVVEEGRVRVATAAEDGVKAGTDEALARTSAAFVELTAGQAVVADAQGHIAAVRSATPGAAQAWREGRVVFNDTPLAEAIAEFERYVDTGLTVRDPAVAALRLNGSVDLRQVQAFKRALSQALPVRLATRPDGKVEIVSDN
jgi:transmembrane sensor